MNRGPNKAGFTLLEILVATAIIVMIVSMVYGSYYATSRSTEIYKAKMTHAQRVRGALQQMARQIRCSYVPQPQETIRDANEVARRSAGGSLGNSKPLSWRRKPLWQSAMKYFQGDPDAATGEILRFVTTNATPTESDAEHGLFEIAYKYDARSATLLREQTRFIATPAMATKVGDYQSFLKNVERIEMQFYDGQQWLAKWDSTQAPMLPRAVRIEITVRDEDRRQFRYSTTAHVACSKPQHNDPVTGRSSLALNQ